MILLLIFIVLFFALAGFFSGMETGLISLKHYRIKDEAKKDEVKKEILDFLKSPDKILGTTLLGTNISVVIVSTLSVYLIKNYYHRRIDENLFSLIIAGLLLIFSEIIPKAIYREKSHILVPKYFGLLKLFYNLFKPFVNFIGKIQMLVSRIIKLKEGKIQESLSYDDISFIVNKSKIASKIEEEIKTMLSEGLDFATKKVENVMTPRLDIVAFEEQTPIPKVIEIAKKYGFSRFPVYREELDNITGILIIYDLLKKKNYLNLKAKDFIRDSFFVGETMSALKLLKAMKKNRKSIAIIVDSFGGTAGLVTIEDLLEEFMGEIDDEYDTNEKPHIEKISNNEYLIDGFVEIEAINDSLNINLPEGDYETIAGLVIDKTEKIPERGTKITTKNYEITVVKSDKRKVDKVKLTILSSKKRKK